MIKGLKNLAILIASGLLVACGAASDATSGNNSIPIDTISPTITSIKPDLIKDSEIVTNTTSITFTFDEPLDPATASPSVLNNKLGFTTSSGKKLMGAWTYNENTSELSFEFDFTSLGENAQSLPTDEAFILHFNNTVKDLSGNGINYTVTFNTPLTYDIELTTTGLPDNSNIEVRIEDQAKTNPQSSINQIIAANGVISIDAHFKTDTAFLLSINQQPNADTFCSFSKASGKILGRDSKVKLNCSNVVPYAVGAANWNSYYSQNIIDANNNIIPKPNVHGGEQRKFTMSNLDNCDNLVIKDDLNAFNWACEIDATAPSMPKTIIYSTGLKAGTYLSNLLSFSRTNPGWLPNSVSVKQNGSAELNQKKTSAVWWNNPVVIPTTSTLSSPETIYIIPDNEPDVSRNYSIEGRHIALVVKPDVVLKTSLNASYAIQVKNTDAITSTGIWLEGNINANISKIGVYISNGYYTQIRNFKISNATGDGIQINNSELTYLFDVSTTQNGGNGLNIIGNTYRNVKVFGNVSHNVTTAYNTANGLLINSLYNKFSLIDANNNKLNGISTALYNYISDSQVRNNTDNGLVINGHNNIITMLTASSNGNAGILFTQSSVEPKKNFLSSITTTNILFDSSVADAVFADNNLINIVDESQGDTVINDFNSSPTALNDYTFVGDSVITYLENAVELLNDGSGNDNGMCEAGEKCLFTPNTGHHQGQGSLEEVADTENVWSSENITLEKYSNTSPL